MSRQKSFTKRTIGSWRPLLIFTIILMAWWLVPPLIKNNAKSALLQIQAPLWTSVRIFHDLSLYWGLKSESKDTLIEELRDLARENAALKLKLQTLSLAETHNERLTQLLDLPKSTEFKYHLAPVYTRDLTTWWDRIIIGAGKKDGITIGMGVVCGEGVVGKIINITQHTAIVELTTSPLFRTVATFENDPRPVTYQGTLNRPLQNPIGLLYKAPTDIQTTPNNPLRLISSALGGLFPEGLTIGYVKNLSIESDGLFQYATVELPKILLNLHEVAVLIPINPMEISL
jgi:rod shape-determining protein MreC